jgi:hypothetical protein
MDGSVRSPLRTYSSGSTPDRVFDLDNDAERIELYQILLTDGDVADICGNLNHTDLSRL